MANLTKQLFPMPKLSRTFSRQWNNKCEICVKNFVALCVINTLRPKFCSQMLLVVVGNFNIKKFIIIFNILLTRMRDYFLSETTHSSRIGTSCCFCFVLLIYVFVLCIIYHAVHKLIRQITIIKRGPVSEIHDDSPSYTSDFQNQYLIPSTNISF